MQSSNKQKKSGLMRDDAARDSMRMCGFDELVIDETIKKLLEIYGEDGWILTEEGRYDVVLPNCLEKQQIKENENAEKLRADYAVFSDNGMKSSHNGDTEETDPNEEDDDDDDDGEMIMLTLEPLCQELEELLREVSAKKKREPVLVLENNSEPRRSTREKKSNPKFL